MRFHKQRCCRVKRDTLCVLHFTMEKIGYENPHIATVALRYGVKSKIYCDFPVFFVDLLYSRFVTFHEVAVGFFVKMCQGETKDWIFLTDIVYVKTRKNARIAKVAIFFCTIVLTNLFARDIMFACQSDK